MQSLYHMVQTWSNLLHSNDDLYLNLNYDLVTNLALAMNTKVVHNDTLNMFKLFIRSHKQFIHWVHIKLSRSTCVASLKYLIMQSDLHEHCSISHSNYSYDVLVTHIPIYMYSLMVICIYTRKHKITSMFHMFQAHVSIVKAYPWMLDAHAHAMWVKLCKLNT